MTMTVAFVLSGAANYGALQVGALQVLLERGIQPDLLVGTSAGAMNAAHLALDATPDGARRLAEFWLAAPNDMLARGNPLLMLWRLIARRDGLLPNDPLRRFVERTLPPGVARYGDLLLPARAVAVRLDTGELRCFGDDPNDRLLDGLMASTAIPGFYPPWMVDGVAYVDGGVMAYLPIQMAVERGATEVYALNVSAFDTRVAGLRGTLAIAGRAMTLLLQRQGAREVEVHRSLPGVTVHHLELSSQHEIAFWDFSKAEEMIAAGREIAAAYLSARPRPEARARRWRQWFARRVRAPAAVPRRRLEAR
jgi:NTE family protein